MIEFEDYFDEFEDYLDANIYEPLLEMIKKLEERIIALELKLDRNRDPNPPDGWYFEY